MKYKIYEVPVVGIWWVLRNLRYIYWSLFHRILGPLKFSIIGKSVKFNGLVRVEHPFSSIEIGDNTMIGVGCYFLAKKPGNIVIGTNVGINDYCYITSCYGIRIGNNVRIAEQVSIRDYNHNFTDSNELIWKQGIIGSEIIIEDDVWVGRGVMITSGVTIGTGCVIGANSVVTKDLPAWSIAVGAPAKVIKTRNH